MIGKLTAEEWCLLGIGTSRGTRVGPLHRASLTSRKAVTYSPAHVSTVSWRSRLALTNQAVLFTMPDFLVFCPQDSKHVIQS